MPGEEIEPPLPTAFRRWVPSPQTLHFVPLGGPTSVVATPAKPAQSLRSLGGPTSVVATATTNVRSERCRFPQARQGRPGRKGVTYGHVAERLAVLRGLVKRHRQHVRVVVGNQTWMG